MAQLNLIPLRAQTFLPFSPQPVSTVVSPIATKVPISMGWNDFFSDTFSMGRA